MAQSVLGCLAILVYVINQKLFNLASGRFSGQVQKAATFFAIISQEWFLGRLLLFLPLKFMMGYTLYTNCLPYHCMLLLGWIIKLQLKQSSIFLDHRSTFHQKAKWSVLSEQYLTPGISFCLSHCFIDVKRHHGQNNSYKKKARN